METLIRTRDKKNKKWLVELISCIFKNEDIYHQKSFVKTCFEYMVSLLEDNGGQPIFQLKVLASAIQNILRFIVSSQYMLE